MFRTHGGRGAAHSRRVLTFFSHIAVNMLFIARACIVCHFQHNVLHFQHQRQRGAFLARCCRLCFWLGYVLGQFPPSIAYSARQSKRHLLAVHHPTTSVG